MQFLKKNYGLLIILILSFWAVRSFFAEGFFPMHDDTQVARVFEMGKVLGAGVFPVRVVPDLGYGFGYPIFNFYAPLAYYAGGIFTLLGFDALIATKIMMVLGIVLAGIFMYTLAREFFGEVGGAVAGLFYLYAPYHALNIYVRGDVAEFWAYAFIPLAFLGIYKRNILLGTIGFAAIILSHNLTAMMITPFLLVVASINYYHDFKEKKSLIINPLSLIFILGLAISAFYWVPALAEMKYTNVLSQIGGGSDFRDHFVCIGQLWNSPWGFGGSAPGCIDGLSFKIGKLHILVSAAAFIFVLMVNKIRKDANGVAILLSSLGLALSVVLMLEISRPLWESISVMAFFQFPWRFSILVTFFSSFLAGSVVILSRHFRLNHFVVALPLVFILIFLNQKLFVPQTILLKTAQDYTNETTLKWTVSKISDEYLPVGFKKPKNQNQINKGQSEIKVPETPVEKFSDIVSLVGLLALIVGIILMRRKAKHE